MIRIDVLQQDESVAVRSKSYAAQYPQAVEPGSPTSISPSASQDFTRDLSFSSNLSGYAGTIRQSEFNHSYLATSTRTPSVVASPTGTPPNGPALNWKMPCQILLKAMR